MNPLLWIQLAEALAPLVVKLLEVAKPEIEALVNKIATAEPLHIEIATAARRVITVVAPS